MRAVTSAALLALLACASRPPEPAVLDTRNDQCGFCRMAVSDARFAAQVVAPREEPIFFDDLGCLAGFISEDGLPRGARVFVADHRNRVWVEASAAVYTKLQGPATPMGSEVVAHASAASRDADPDAREGVPLSIADVFGSAEPAPGN